MAALDLPSIVIAGFPQTLWGRELGFVMEHYRSLAGIYLNGEDLPRATNRITLNPEVKDQFGLPVANIHVDDHPNNAAMRRHGQQQAKAMFEAAGAIKVVMSRQTPATHNMCTARMSHDSKDGVVNAHGQTHDVANLFVSLIVARALATFAIRRAAVLVLCAILVIEQINLVWPPMMSRTRALAWIDAVHYAAHEPIDVREVGADVERAAAGREGERPAPARTHGDR